MIFRETITIAGNGATYPANVQPLKTTETTGGALILATYYRLFCGPEVAISASSGLSWRGRNFNVQGDVEQWHRNGRLHHQEATLQETA